MPKRKDFTDKRTKKKQRFLSGFAPTPSKPITPTTIKEETSEKQDAIHSEVKHQKRSG